MSHILTYTKLDGTRKSYAYDSVRELSAAIESLKARCPAGHDLAMETHEETWPEYCARVYGDVDPAKIWAEISAAAESECARGLENGFDALAMGL